MEALVPSDCTSPSALHCRRNVMNPCCCCCGRSGVHSLQNCKITVCNGAWVQNSCGFQFLSCGSGSVWYVDVCDCAGSCLCRESTLASLSFLTWNTSALFDQTSGMFCRCLVHPLFIQYLLWKTGLGKLNSIKQCFLCFSCFFWLFHADRF